MDVGDEQKEEDVTYRKPQESLTKRESTRNSLWLRELCKDTEMGKQVGRQMCPDLQSRG